MDPIDRKVAAVASSLKKIFEGRMDRIDRRIDALEDRLDEIIAIVEEEDEEEYQKRMEEKKKARRQRKPYPVEPDPDNPYAPQNRKDQPEEKHKGAKNKATYIVPICIY